LTDFSTEVERHIGPLRRYARALLRNRSDADDLVQDSLARALSRRYCYQPGTNLRAWLFTIMHNLHANQVRREVARPESLGVDDLAPRLAASGGQDDRIALRDLSRALAVLPAEQRQVLLLVGLEGLKYEEVAEALDIPVGTVMSRLSRAREALRQHLSGEMPALRRVK